MPERIMSQWTWTITLFVLLLFNFSIPSVDSRIDPVKSKHFEGDIIMSGKDKKSFLNEVMFTGKIQNVHTWNNGKVPYVISPMFDSSQKEMIQGAMQEISGDTCIHFVERDGDKDYIEFVKDDAKCSSGVGRTGNRQMVLMSPNKCMRHGTVVHELLHTLGLYHEQSRPDRDKFITIVWDNLKKPESRVNFEKYGTKFWKDHKLPYDYASIMHYSSNAFSREYGLKTILTKTDSAPIGQRTSMSHFDKVKINLLYDCQIPEDW